jgi:hypothetical protein
MNAQKAIRQDSALQKLAQLALDEPRNKTLAAALSGQECLEVFGDYTMENANRRIAGGVIRGGMMCGNNVIQPRAAVISTSWLLVGR